ncbi:alpha/beta fold hydrolase [Pseudooceanicola sp. 216_PA32_1]|uniref:Alpha/beta fold hydrolase n=1 Tax=Pseudooceanicola pacificus TaxID=2676438 RepID=A0A844WF59_9RHOB|nr:alpha/beta fold hydrolase [Pseudooceanicola pacificus]MWB79632.1 alpha/beta fold hydrolase [Pseudooceanicola pacificus]
MARILLIHGACHGAWCWRDVIPALEALGHEALALDMPGRAGDTRDAATLTLGDHAAAILNAAGDGALLVGHSAGGFSISAAAEAAPDKVRGLVYVAALLPQDGDTLVGKMRGLEPTDAPARFARALDGNGYIFDTAGAADLLYNGVAPADADWALSMVCPEPNAPHREAIRLGTAFAAVPKTYVRCTEDRIIPANDQARMARAGCAALHDIATGHSPFLSTPARLAGLIAAAAA